jgi:hypothetical protein
MDILKKLNLLKKQYSVVVKDVISIGTHRGNYTSVSRKVTTWLRSPHLSDQHRF